MGDDRDTLIDIAFRNPQMCCLGFGSALAFLLCSFMGWSASSLSYMDDHRLHKIRIYEDSVRIWNKSAWYRFNDAHAMECVIHWDTPGIDLPSQSLTFLPISSESKLKDKELLKLPSPIMYQPLEYTFSGKLELPEMPWVALKARLDFSSVRGSFSVPVNFSRVDTINLGSWKVCYHQRHGAWVKNKCMVYWELKSMCLVLNWNDTIAEWAPRKTSSGCGKSLDTPFAYTTKRSGRHSGPTTLNLSTMTLTLKSAEDPHVVAMGLTGGTLEFGTSKSQRLEELGVWTALGMGSLFLFLGIITCCWWGCACFSDEDMPRNLNGERDRTLRALGDRLSEMKPYTRQRKGWIRVDGGDDHE